MKRLIMFIITALLILTGCNGSTKNSIDPDDNSVIAATEDENANSEKPEEKTDVKPEIKPIKSGYIDFVPTYYYYKTDDFDSVDAPIHVIKSYEDWEAFLTDNDVTTKLEYNEDFFKEKAAIILILPAGSSSVTFCPKNVYIDEKGLLTATATMSYPAGQDADYHLRLFTYEVNKEDIAQISGAEMVLERLYDDSYYPDEGIIPNEMLKHTEFSGYIASNPLWPYMTQLGWVEIAKSEYELKQITDRYAYSGDGESLLDYTANLDENFFDDTVLALLSFKSSYNNTVLELQRTDVSENGIVLHIYRDYSKATDYEYTENVIAVEIPRSEFIKSYRLTVKFNITEYDYTQKVGGIDYTPYVFKACTDGRHVNAALDDVNYLWNIRCVISAEDWQKQLEEFCGECPVDDEFKALSETFNEEFFKENAILFVPVHVDKGERVKIKDVRRENIRGFGALMLDVKIYDSVKPSSDKDNDIESYIAMAVIDKTETMGYDWLLCDYEIK
ncbi:MAG: membrane lipoprotein lipid attachment site-containing protein [Clostridia bacterium]|nr:membrane lipoprotein lipid attachment site-containing protein [Clostridia bacterium]